MGAFGELLLLGLAERAGAGEDVLRVMRDHLYRPEGGQGVKGADLTFTDAATGERVGIDAKTFDCAPNKRLFAINDKKHEELGGEATHYFCVSGRPLGTHVAVAALIPYADVDRWPRADLGGFGSPSRNLPIEKFFAAYHGEAGLLERLRAAPVLERAAVQRAGKDERVIEEMRSILE